ncbi:hypothetical protein LCGC14_0232830 [marine sediment metagenome]|uniref:Uncharacterized protein n=1 Tax=marine sediment metagenome TaxID=412755 RepID=A0A0F9WUH3_9ZZZZ
MRATKTLVDVSGEGADDWGRCYGMLMNATTVINKIMKEEPSNGN